MFTLPMEFPAYHKNLIKNELKEIAKGFIPSGILRMRMWLRYRKWFPMAFITSDSVVHRNADIGLNCIIRKSNVGERVSIGNYTTLGSGCRLGGKGKIKIGKFCSIGPETLILSENHNSSYITTYPLEQVLKGNEDEWHEYVGEDIVIGNDVWIGHRVIILAGSQIGDGCIVAAGSVIPRCQIPPYSIIAGVPGRIIKERFDREMAERLLKVAWWDRTDKEIFSELMHKLHNGSGFF